MSKKQLEGKIKALSGVNTVSVGVTTVFHHRRYRKRVRASKTYLAHLEGKAEVGQSVIIEESRPISRRKRWVVIEIEGSPVKKVQEIPETAKVAPVKEKPVRRRRVGRAKR